MNLHEYQAKDVFRNYGIAVPAGRVAASADEAVEAAEAHGDRSYALGSYQVSDGSVETDLHLYVFSLRCRHCLPNQ